MAQDSEDEVWEQILVNANQLAFPEWDEFPEDKESEKITKELDSVFCSCDNRQETKVEIAGEIVYVCKKSLGGCGREIKK